MKLWPYFNRKQKSEDSLQNNKDKTIIEIISGKDMTQDFGYAPDKGMKLDQGKPRMDLLDPSFTIGVAKVLTFGAGKYEANNWRKGIEFSRLISAIHRHLAAIQQGEFIDPESGEPHVYHIGCNIMFLGWMMENKPELNDLPE